MSTSRATTRTPEFLFFGGKGGVGKTTCAAARAVVAARAGSRVLVISTDPAHSLGDALDIRLTHRVTTVNIGPLTGRRPRGGKSCLHAVELDAPRAFARWLRTNRAALGDVLEHGTWLDRGDVQSLISLPMPGVDELVGMLEIVNLAAAADYDAVIVDTAPTGHALRLLASPGTVENVSALLEELQREHRAIREQLARVVRADAADRLIALLARQAQDTGALIHDRKRTGFHWVLLPELLSLAESEDGLAALRRARIPVAALIVNRLIPAGPRCPVCDRRRAEESRVVARIHRRFGRTAPISVVLDELREPRGVARLAAVGARLATLQRAPSKRAARVQVSAPPSAPAMSISSDDRAAATGALERFRGAHLLFVGGKGGVGKTTTAAAVSVALARDQARRRVLLLSTDPAHSVGDVFMCTAGDTPRTVRGAPPNLHIRELDAAAALAVRRTELQAALEEILGASGIESIPDSGRMSRLLELAPPGIDELFGVLSVVDVHSQYDSVVVDMAPTGHALRLLEMPGVAREWIQALLQVLLKYRELVRPGPLASSLVEVSKSVRQLQHLLNDPSMTRFVVVTRAAEVPRLETERLLRRLRRLGLATPAIVVNARTLAPGRCRRCRAVALSERRQVARLRKAVSRRRGDRVIIQTPLSVPPPRGVVALERWGRTWLS